MAYGEFTGRSVRREHVVERQERARRQRIEGSCDERRNFHEAELAIQKGLYGNLVGRIQRRRRAITRTQGPKR